MCVRFGSVPPIITGLPSLSTSGANAWTWVERTEPRNATMSDCAASLENPSTMPVLGGLIVLDPQLELFAQYTAGFVDGRERKFGAVLLPEPLFGRRPGDGN